MSTYSQGNNFQEFFEIIKQYPNYPNTTVTGPKFYLDFEYQRDIFAQPIPANSKPPTIVTLPFSQKKISLGIPSHLNDNISSMKSADCAWIFSDDKFRGTVDAMESSVTGLPSPGYRMPNNRISSIYIADPLPEGFNHARPLDKGACRQAILYQHSIAAKVPAGWTAAQMPQGSSNTHGDVYPIFPEFFIKNLKSVGFNDKTSSVYVPVNHCLRVWNDVPSDSVLANNSSTWNWFHNPSYIFYPGTHDVPAHLNDKISAAQLSMYCETPPYDANPFIQSTQQNLRDYLTFQFIN